MRNGKIGGVRTATVAAIVVLGLLGACGGGGGSGGGGDFERADGVKTSDRSDDQTDATDDQTDATDATDATDNQTDATDDQTDATDNQTDATDDQTDATDNQTDATDGTDDGIVQPVEGEVDDIIVRETITDLNQWWTQQFPAIYPGQTYSPPVVGAWSLRPGQTVPCGSVVVVYDDVANNAIYAPCDDQTDGVFFDVEQLIPSLAASSGQFAPAFVAAHEWGHLIQARGAEANDVSVTLELQADCFAGSWVAHVIQDGTPFQILASDIDVALSALLSVADPVGFGATEEGAHGSGFDRVSAFAAGLGDINSCLTYQTDPPPIFEMQFTTQTDAESGGNLPLLQIADLAKKDLETFFLSEIDANYPLPGPYQQGTCDGREVILSYCPSSGLIVFNPDRLQAFHDFLGDFATGTLLARAYAATIDVAPQVANCITGAWARSLILNADADPPIYNLQLSPGDLDEAVRVFLLESMDGDGILSVTSMRRGIVEGLDACTEIAQNG